MQTVKAISLAPGANDWLVNSWQPSVLHIFDRACNLINEHGDILSIVTPQIGNGPFNLIIENDDLSTEHIGLMSPISISPHQLTLGNITIHTADAKLWNPRPDWERLYAKRNNIAHQLTQLQITNYQKHRLGTFLTANIRDYPTSNIQSLTLALHASAGVSNLTHFFAIADLPSSLTAAKKLSGLGSGLTPAGDDFIMGALYAAWIIHPPEVASALALAIANTAAPLTTSLSAAWLRAAGRGEVGELWHAFFNALLIADSSAIQLEVVRLLSIGHTSGADALAGFVSTFACLSTMP